MYLYRGALSLQALPVLIDTIYDFTEMYSLEGGIKGYKDMHKIPIVIDCKINTTKGSCTKWAFNLWPRAWVARAHTPRQAIHHGRYLWQINPLKMPPTLTGQYLWYLIVSTCNGVRGRTPRSSASPDTRVWRVQIAPTPSTSRFPIYFLPRVEWRWPRRLEESWNRYHGNSVICMLMNIACCKTYNNIEILIKKIIISNLTLWKIGLPMIGYSHKILILRLRFMSLATDDDVTPLFPKGETLILQSIYNLWR